MIHTRTLQERLAELGFNPGPIDGVMGPRTEAAVVAFKKSVGLRARPYIGPITYEALFGTSVSDDLPWFNEAMRVKGLHEGRDTRRLKTWFDHKVAAIDPREIPWCGAFVLTCIRRWNPSHIVPHMPLGARNWRAFGDPCVPQLGALLVFWRGSPNGWKGHVGFYYGEDDTCYHVLGGNQSNAVTITRISKRRLLGARWPHDVDRPEKRILLTSKGIPVSENEA